MTQRIATAASHIPPIGAVTGWAACRLHGAAFHDGLAPDGRTRLPVPIAVGTRGWVRRHPSATYSYAAIDMDCVHTIAGVPATDPVRATYDAMRAATLLVDAVVELEKSVMAGIISLEEMAAYVQTKAGTQGVRLIREAVPLASEFSRSPQEVRTRFVAEQVARVPRLLVNSTAWTVDGLRIGEVDLADPTSGLVIEFNGAYHEDGPRRHADAVRLERLRAVGAELLQVTTPQLGSHQSLAQTIVAARMRALTTPGEQRRYRFVPRQPFLHQQLLARRALAGLNASLEDRCR
ncbi:hypothetical protein [Nocardioides jiangxiensis]|uniref:DUF559 domain-containing protein n=1 Tax=Nocardioides jiangxiensis TaxID=3064524 RepID=A0ABT9AZR0_9ACTN|nr:hypothetical protein [Nocardioides sp. WY-20]MDO7868084.1 hypothetical protein [Nocardioides sp. WY-20]